MAEAMRVIVALLLCSRFCVPAMAQGFWEPGACWRYDDGLGINGEQYQYIGDTMILGVSVQVSSHKMCWIDGLGVFHCWANIGPFYDYFTLQGDVVLVPDGSFTAMDTMFWLGVPGDRWWIPGSEEYCNGYYGMQEIQDTGHVVYDGISLRTWEVATLSPSGTPAGGFTETITERIGGVPRRFCPAICSMITDCEPSSLRNLVHYSDGEINIPLGTTCDMATSTPGVGSVSSLRIAPNPGVDQLTRSRSGIHLVA